MVFFKHRPLPFSLETSILDTTHQLLHLPGKVRRGYHQDSFCFFLLGFQYTTDTYVLLL